MSHRLPSGFAPRFSKPVFFYHSGAPQADLRIPFEAGKVIVSDGFSIEGLDYFLRHPGRWHPDWIPPVFSKSIFKSITPDHALRSVCEDDGDIVRFQNNVNLFEPSWQNLMSQLFPEYKSEYISFSYRFNHMALGNLHLDVPEAEYEEHQFRWFINLDSRPRILTVGPSIFELAQMFWNEKDLQRHAELPVHLFIKELRHDTLDSTVYKERELPRHYLTLDPGAMWLSHSSYTTHGIVYGRKTACLECRVRPTTMARPERHFNSMIRALQRHGPQSEPKLEKLALSWQ